MKIRYVLLAAAFFSISNAPAATLYVSLASTNPVLPYVTWSTAATNIQDAIDVAAPGDLILVTNGVYQTGGRVVYDALTNRVVINKSVTVQSVNGPAATMIQGNPPVIQGYSYIGTNAVRCVYLAANAVLSGFMLTNGATSSLGDTNKDESGGGAWCENTSAILTNCVISGNLAYDFGGGVFNGTLENCVVSGNTSSFITYSSINTIYGPGGGAYGSTLSNCVVTGNSSWVGGGVANGTLYQCIVSNNMAEAVIYVLYGFGGGLANCAAYNCQILNNHTAANCGGAWTCVLNNCLISGNDNYGAFYSTLYNCTVVNNAYGVYSSTLFNSISYYNVGLNYYVATFTNSCTTPMPSGSFATITNAPMFVATNVFYLLPGSPCIDTGNNAYVTTATDLNGNPRIVNGTVDMGAYELQNTPFIAIQPADQTVPFGQPTVLFTVVAVGPGTLAYQWQFNGANISGATNFTYTLDFVQYTNAGTYSVLVTNSFGSVTSSNSVLTVVPPTPPSFTTQPSNQTVVPVGTNVSLTAIATGAPAPGYQWYFNGTALMDGPHYYGSAGTSLQIFNVQTNDTGNYFVIATNVGGAATSLVAAITVMVSPAITMQPASQSVVQGSNALFTAAVSGDAPLGYLWFFNGRLLVDGGQFSGTATTNLTISNIQPTNGGSYTLLVTNSVGSDLSTAAVLTVLSPPSFTEQPPSSQNVLQGSNTVFSTSVTGTAPFSYQWYFNGSPLTDGGRVSGSVTSVLNIANAQTNDSGFYQLIVTNNYGSATSIVSTLSVQLPVAILGQPTNQTVLAGSNVSFTVTATGFAPPNYLWYSNGMAMSNGGRISGATSATLTISNTQTNDTATYHVIVTNIYGSATSSVATLTVIAPVQILGQPASQDALLGSNVTFTVTATGTGPLNYQWFFNGAPLSDAARITGSATPALSISNVQSTDAGGYRVVISNLLSSATSLTASLTPQTVLAPSVRYVMLTSTNPQSPYLDWSTAATNIQDAVDAAVAGDSIIVSNGIYNFGARTVYGTGTNRVVINKPVTVQSLNGPAVTSIAGPYVSPAGTYYIGRCAYLTNGAFLSGFTLTSGGASTTGDIVHEKSGGAVWCEAPNAVISNCVIFANYAPYGYGGGAFGGTLVNCLLTNNSAADGGGTASNILLNCALIKNTTRGQSIPYGGGALGSALSNCLVIANTSSYGGGAAFSALTSCTVSNNNATYGGGVFMGTASFSVISSNIAYDYGAGAFSNVLNNCIVENNWAYSLGSGAYISVLNSCTVVSNTTSGGGAIWGGTATNSIIYYNSGYNVVDTKSIAYTCTFPLQAGPGNITNAPLFVNLAGENFHLQFNSPCINSGNNAYVTVSNDFDGNPRIVGGTVDMGAYEYQTPTSVISYAYLQQYGLPTDGSVDFADLDGTAFNVYQDWLAGLNPTNPASVLAISPLVATNNSHGITVTWQSVSNRNYYLQRADDLSAEPPFSTIQSNIVGHAGTTSYTDTTATNTGPYFYRVGVQQQ